MKTMFLISAVLVAACGGGGGDDMADDGDDGMTADAAPQPDMRVQATCTAAQTYGTVTPTASEAIHDATNDVYFSTSGLNMDADVLQMQFYSGFGVFMNGVMPGTYQITGAEAQYSSCGVCGLLFADVTMAAPPSLADANRVYFATAGTVNITSVTPNLTGTVTGLQFQHVTIDPMTFTSTVVGDCTSSIDSLAFDATVMEQKPGRPGVPQPITLNLRRN
jgi:hypothetical protein